MSNNEQRVSEIIEHYKRDTIDLDNLTIEELVKLYHKNNSTLITLTDEIRKRTLEANSTLEKIHKKQKENVIGINDDFKQKPEEV